MMKHIRFTLFGILLAVTAIATNISPLSAMGKKQPEEKSSAELPDLMAGRQHGRHDLDEDQEKPTVGDGEEEKAPARKTRKKRARQGLKTQAPAASSPHEEVQSTLVSLPATPASLMAALTETTLVPLHPTPVATALCNMCRHSEVLPPYMQELLRDTLSDLDAFNHLPTDVQLPHRLTQQMSLLGQMCGHEDLKRLRDTLTTDIEQLTKQTAELNARLEEAQTQSAAQQNHIRKLEGQLDEKQQELADARIRLAELSGERDRIQHDLVQTQDQLRERQIALLTAEITFFEGACIPQIHAILASLTLVEASKQIYLQPHDVLYGTLSGLLCLVSGGGWLRAGFLIFGTTFSAGGFRRLKDNCASILGYLAMPVRLLQQRKAPASLPSISIGVLRPQIEGLVTTIETTIAELKRMRDELATTGGAASDSGSH